MQSTQENFPLLSIVIATRNRVKYARAAIKQILSIADPRLELVVQDNSDKSELGEWINENERDVRLVYQHTAQPLSFVGNFDKAARLATGTYLCFVGDDDGVNPEIIEAACWALKQGLDALVPLNPVNYVWPGAGIPPTFFSKTDFGSLSILPITVALCGVNLEKELAALMRNGGLYYLETNLPRLYHGLVSRKCVQMVCDRTGAYFGGLSPDVYSSVAIACVCQKACTIDYPLTIAGICGASGSAVEGGIKRHSKDLAAAPHLNNRGLYNWSRLVPNVYTVQTIWVDSEVAALTDMGRGDLIAKLNTIRLAAHCMANNRGVAGRLIDYLVKDAKSRGKKPYWDVLQFTSHAISIKFRKALYRFFNRLQIILGNKKLNIETGIVDIGEAGKFLSNYLRANNLSFARYVSEANIKTTGWRL